MSIYHITARSAWEKARAAHTYRPESLEKEGFIHCSTLAQIIATANRYYRGQHGLVLLVIDPSRIQAEVCYENTTGGEETFPHIYGALNLDAVTAVIPFEPDEGGVFHLPDELV
jgi:uncharacterized protein (DUF952 family)